MLRSVCTSLLHPIAAGGAHACPRFIPLSLLPQFPVLSLIASLPNRHTLNLFASSPGFLAQFSHCPNPLSCRSSLLTSSNPTQVLRVFESYLSQLPPLPAGLISLHIQNSCGMKFLLPWRNCTACWSSRFRATASRSYRPCWTRSYGLTSPGPKSPLCRRYGSYQQVLQTTRAGWLQRIPFGLRVFDLPPHSMRPVFAANRGVLEAIFRFSGKPAGFARAISYRKVDLPAHSSIFTAWTVSPNPNSQCKPNLLYQPYGHPLAIKDPAVVDCGRARPSFPCATYRSFEGSSP